MEVFRLVLEFHGVLDGSCCRSFVATRVVYRASVPEFPRQPSPHDPFRSTRDDSSTHIFSRRRPPLQIASPVPGSLSSSASSCSHCFFLVRAFVLLHRFRTFSGVPLPAWETSSVFRFLALGFRRLHLHVPR
eukprot:scaffold1420_cov375-Pavlova_lutheri.AAC.36